jgi:RNA polymerase primary sigma factor
MTALAILSRKSSNLHDRSSAVFAALSEHERELLQEALALPLSHVNNRLFSKPTAEQELFDETHPFAPDLADWYHLSSRSRPAAPTTSRSSRLSVDEEQQLFLQYNFARMRAAEAVSRFRTRASRSNAKPVILWYGRVKDTRDLIARANLALVLAMAKRVRGRRVDFGDLISEGNMALLRAIDAFDVARGFKFSTYACRAIFKAYGRLVLRAGRYRKMFPTQFDPALECSDYQETRRAQDQQEVVSELRQILRDNRAKLSDAEKTVLASRFALRSEDPSSTMTLEEVGKVMGVTKECVRQIQNKALAKLKAALESEALVR